MDVFRRALILCVPCLVLAVLRVLCCEKGAVQSCGSSEDRMFRHILPPLAVFWAFLFTGLSVGAHAALPSGPAPVLLSDLLTLLLSAGMAEAAGYALRGLLRGKRPGLPAPFPPLFAVLTPLLSGVSYLILRSLVW